MLNKKVVTVDLREGTICRIVSLDDLKGLSVPEQFEMLERSGYHRGSSNYLTPTFLKEWQMIVAADEGGYVADKWVDLLSTEKLTVPFVLKDRRGVVIDEYNFNLIYYYDSDPARLVAQCWIRGGEKETAFTMPLTEIPFPNDLRSVINAPAEYILTKHDIKCFEERIFFHFSDSTEIVTLSNGRFALATHVCDNGSAWSGFPVCGNGNEKMYLEYIRNHLIAGIDIDDLYEVGKDDCMTFLTREAAQAWADRLRSESSIEAIY